MFWQCSELGIFMHWTGNSMDNLLSSFGLVDARISTSEKDLSVQGILFCKFSADSYAILPEKKPAEFY